MNWDQSFGDWVRLAFTLALATAATIGLSSAIRELIYSLASRRWPTAEAEVLGVSVEERRGARGRTKYEPVVRYRYAREGQQLEATRLAFGTLHASSPAEARRWVAGLKVGTRGLVRVHPARPQMAVLVPGLNGEVWFALVFFLAYATGVVFFTVEAVRPFVR